MNPAIGSALAGIGLTVPVLVPASIVFDLPLVLGLRGRVGRVFEAHRSPMVGLEDSTHPTQIVTISGGV